MIGIVGGGISGLALAWHLEKRGVPYVVLEADAVPGGVMRTYEVDGLPLDVGPQRTRVTTDVAELIEAAGLESETLEAPAGMPLYVYRKGKLREVPFTAGAALSTDLLGWGEKLRMLVEPFTSGPRDDETVEAFFTRKFGPGAYRSMIGPLYGGLYASDPGRMYVRHGLSMTLEHFGARGSLLLTALRRGAKARQELPTVSFTGGMQMLPAALAERLGGRFRPGWKVTSIRPLDENVHPLDDGVDIGVTGGRAAVDRAAAPEGGAPSGGRPRFRIEAEDGRTIDVETVVLSLPAPHAAAIMALISPESGEKLRTLRYNRLAVVHLRPENGSGGVPLRGFGYQIAFGESLETRGVTWNGALFDRDGLCAAYLGGMKNPEVLEWDDERIADVALAEFRTVTGHDARALRVSRTWIPAWDGTWDALDGLELPDGIEVCANWNARPGIPGRAAAARRLAARLQRATSWPSPAAPPPRSSP